ncbi:MAG: immunoglobulin domain-containing protein, partial [Verrucomicrobiota bacterium]
MNSFFHDLARRFCFCFIAGIFSTAIVAPQTARAQAKPSITSQPQSQSITAGTNVAFTVTAGGQSPLIYRWSFNGTNLNNGARITGATLPTLTISNVVAGDAGAYRVVVSNSHGTATSSNAFLFVNSPPTISGIPAQRTFPGVPTRSIGFTIGDIETAASNLVLSAASANTNLIQDQNIVFGGNGSNRTVSITPSGTLQGTAMITITVRDGNGVSGNAAFVLSVAGFTEIAPGLPLIGGGAMAWGDYNNDGRLDIFASGKDANGTTIARVYRNDGTDTFSDSGAMNEGLSFGGIACGDYDRDGYLDVLMNGLLPGEGSGGGYVYAKIHRNTGSGVFTNVAGFYLGAISPVSERLGGAAWFDYDNDGDLDPLFVGWGDRLLRNNGSNFFGSGVNLNSTFNWFWAAAAIADYDNDGGMDFFLTGNGAVELRRNQGSGVFSTIPTSLPALWGSSAAWGDYDNDGYSDLAVQGITSGNAMTTLIYHNDGGGNFSNINAALQPSAFTSVGWGDYDNDGDLDLLVGGLSTTRLYRNDGSNVFTDAGFVLASCYIGNAAFGDYDNDGDLDIVLMGGSAGAYITEIYRNDGAMPNPPPTSPLNLVATNIGSSITMSWDAATDANQTNSWTYNLRVGTSPGSGNIVSPMSDPATGQRRLPALGNAGMRSSWTITNLTQGTYYWSVQAIDHTFAGSAFANEQSIILGPIITTQPQNQTVFAGQTASFSITATGTTSPSYLWRFNGTNISLATSATFVLTNAQFANQGNYSVIVSDQLGSVTSSNAFLTVNSPPLITVQPQNQVAILSNNAAFTLSVTGSVPFGYQWQFNGANLNDATNAALTLSNVQYSQSGNYSALVSNPFGSVTSSIASLIVNGPPVITNPPQNQIVVAGSTALFNVAAQGTQPFGYQWQFNGTNLVGANASSLSIANAQTSNVGNYSVVVNNSYGATTSAVVTLTVNDTAPIISQQPQTQTANAGANATFSVAASGTTPLSYQWQLEGLDLPGKTGSSLVLTNVQSTHAGNYSVIVSNS